MEKGKNILSKLTESFIILIIIVFPLCVDSTGFFRILECKYRYFLIFNVIYISSIIITLSYYWLIKKENLLKDVKLGKIQYALLAYWLVNVISTFLSPYFSKYNLFVGVGRGEGLLNISLYCLSFLNITLFGKFERRYILYFAISSILISFIATLQYIFWLNPFNMYQDGIGFNNVSFLGTIGNLDFVSAIYCILLTVSMAGYIFLEDNKTYEKIIYLTSIGLGFFIFEVLDVLSGAVAFGGTLVLVLPFILTNSKRLSRALIAGGLILFGYFATLTINPVYYNYTHQMVHEYQITPYSIALFVLTVLFIVLGFVFKKRDFDLSKNTKIIKGFYITLICLGLIILLFLYFVNLGSGFFYEIHEILHGNFDDDFGTYRIFLWRRSLSIFKEYPIIGTGPDTFAVRFMAKYTDDIKALGELSINDTAANNYLTILVNLGILGLIAYLNFIAFQLIFSLKKYNKYNIIFLIAFLCYLIQDFFNLWVVIITPIFWVLMAILSLATNYKFTNEGEKENE